MLAKGLQAKNSLRGQPSKYLLGKCSEDGRLASGSRAAMNAFPVNQNSKPDGTALQSSAANRLSYQRLQKTLTRNMDISMLRFAGLPPLQPLSSRSRTPSLRTGTLARAIDRKPDCL